jgi:hypothetical protein
MDTDIIKAMNQGFIVDDPETGFSKLLPNAPTWAKEAWERVHNATTDGLGAATQY